MKKITICLDSETFRLCNMKAAQNRTSVEHMARDYLRSVAADVSCQPERNESENKAQTECRRKALQEFFNSLDAQRERQGPGEAQGDNRLLTREELHDRAARREEARLYYGSSYGQDAFR